MAVVRRRGVTVRKYFYAGTLVAAALVAAVPAASAAAAPAAPVHVLTTGRAGGPAVAPGAVLKAGLKIRTTAVFKTNLGALTCSTSTFTAKVVSNPAKTGTSATAKESITAQTFSSCRISIRGVTIRSITVGNLPYNGTVSDARGNPVKISGRSRTRPLLVTVVVKIGAGAPFSCSVKAASISGTWSNRGNVVAFANQKFTKAAGGIFCPSSGTFSVTYGPVRDSSVRGNPAVFVN
jgi:hypothetical protein